MIRICSWCKKGLGKKPPYTVPDQVTHTICAACRKQMKLNPRDRTVDETGARELYLFATNDAALYLQRETPIIKNLAQKWKKGVYDHHKAIQLWSYWADDAAKRYAKEFGTSDQPWFRMFNPATRWAVAEQRADFIKGEFELGHYIKNPPAAWHRTQRLEADHYDKLSAKRGRTDLADFYHGKEVAHSESEMHARAERHNPGDDFYDARGKAKYTYLGIAKRIPLHAKKAKEFLKRGDRFNALQHARAVLHLGAEGWIDTKPYRDAQAVMQALERGDPRIHPMSGHYGPEGVGRNPGTLWYVGLTENLTWEVKRLSRPASQPWLWWKGPFELKQYALHFARHTRPPTSWPPTKQNPIAIYGLGNPKPNGRLTRRPFLLYGRTHEYRGEKLYDAELMGPYKHAFKNGVEAWALPAGTKLVFTDGKAWIVKGKPILLQSREGKALWKPH